MDSHILADCTLPVMATESRERSLEAGENLKGLHMSDLCPDFMAYNTYVKLSRRSNFNVMNKLILIPDSER